MNTLRISQEQTVTTYCATWQKSLNKVHAQKTGKHDIEEFYSCIALQIHAFVHKCKCVTLRTGHKTPLTEKSKRQRKHAEKRDVREGRSNTETVATTTTADITQKGTLSRQGDIT